MGECGPNYRAHKPAVEVYPNGLYGGKYGPTGKESSLHKLPRASILFAEPACKPDKNNNLMKN